VASPPARACEQSQALVFIEMTTRRIPTAIRDHPPTVCDHDLPQELANLALKLTGYTFSGQSCLPSTWSLTKHFPSDCAAVYINFFKNELTNISFEL
jgi:hypothetical protein